MIKIMTIKRFGGGPKILTNKTITNKIFKTNKLFSTSGLRQAILALGSATLEVSWTLKKYKKNVTNFAVPPPLPLQVQNLDL